MELQSGQVSVLVPVYNEEKTVTVVVEKVLALGDMIKEVVVVDDGSKDNTAKAMEELAAREPRVRFFKQPKNQGKTAAIRRALAESTGEVIIVQDADLEYDPAEIPEVVGPILKGQADVVFGSRFMVRKASRVLYFYHYLANRSLTFLCNLLTNRNMTDIETGYKAFRSGVIKPLKLTSKKFGMEVEMTAMVCKTNARTYEVPISYYGRSYEEGKHIQYIDGVWAGLYIFHYNLFKPRTRDGRRYIREVNAFLQANPTGQGGQG